MGKADLVQKAASVIVDDPPSAGTRCLPSRESRPHPSWGQPKPRAVVSGRDRPYSISTTRQIQNDSQNQSKRSGKGSYFCPALPRKNRPFLIDFGKYICKICDRKFSCLQHKPPEPFKMIRYQPNTRDIHILYPSVALRTPQKLTNDKHLNLIGAPTNGSKQCIANIALHVILHHIPVSPHDLHPILGDVFGHLS
jgi:hypothetical protein